MRPSVRSLSCAYVLSVDLLLTVVSRFHFRLKPVSLSSTVCRTSRSSITNLGSIVSGLQPVTQRSRRVLLPANISRVVCGIAKGLDVRETCRVLQIDAS